jgi:hypothetical protein
VRAEDQLGNAASASRSFVMTHTPKPTPTPTPTPTAEPTAAPIPPSGPARAVQKRLRRLSPTKVARMQPFRLSYTAPAAGTLTVKVQLRGRRSVTVASARGKFRAGQRRSLRVRRTKAARQLRPRTRAGLRITVTFSPADGKPVKASRTVTLTRR